MQTDPGKPPEPAGNLPERSVAGAKIVWWGLALVIILLFCALAWMMHNGGGGLPVT